MKSLHLTIVLFCHVLLASIVLYFTSLTEASPLSLDTGHVNQKPFEDAKHSGFVVTKIEHKPQIPSAVLAAVALAPQASVGLQSQPKRAAAATESKPEPRSAVPEQVAPGVVAVVPQQAVPATVDVATDIKQAPAVVVVAPAAAAPAPAAAVQSQSEPVASAEPQLVLTERKAELKESKQDSVAAIVKQDAVVPIVPSQSAPIIEPLKPIQEGTFKPVESGEPARRVDASMVPLEVPVVVKHEDAPIKPVAAPVAAPVVPAVAVVSVNKELPQPAALIAAAPAAAPAAAVDLHKEQPQSAALMATEYKSDANPEVGRPAAAAPAPVQEVQKSPVEQTATRSAQEPSVLSVVVKEDYSNQRKQQQQQVQPASMVSAPEMALTTGAGADKSSAGKPVAQITVAMGGLGPLHLLATTLCSYQPDKAVADESLNQLYARRASVRKSLFEFMSLKFTNLEKLSSRLGYGLQVVPIKSSIDNKSPSVTPSHGWPVVGKCTAHDLKLMGEAAWCECNSDSEQGCPSNDKPAVAAAAAAAASDKAEVAASGAATAADKAAPAPAPVAPVASSSRLNAARSIAATNSFLPSPEESSVISKLLHVSDTKDAPTVESTIYSLNLTQHQLATLEAHATSTQQCRRNSLRYTKALFNHLAEDQREVSESWPKLYALISADDCARKRMIDIVSALSSFRTDTTSIRRDNLEFAFAMDDLRAKVLESEVNVPLTFDRHFIEVEQFLQQSVRLMLANVQPKRAKVTSMRYRSLMYGASQQAFDDQCIDLHQRLLANNYPSDCNPTQFGQLPDVLRMTASSLELWSIEKQLSLQSAKIADYPNSSAVGQQKVKDDVNECIANLVSS